MRLFTSTAVILAGMAIIIGPWIFRNHRVLNAWILVSSNGGDVFYRANNPSARGGFTPVGEQNLGLLDEVMLNDVGFRLGKEWILRHPGSFLSLSLRKQILFLGDDSYGVFETMKRDHDIHDTRYSILKGVSNLYWWMVWALILAALYRSRHSLLKRNRRLLILMLSVLYLYGIHSVFESNGKHHEVLLPVLAILAATAAHTVTSFYRLEG